MPKPRKLFFTKPSKWPGTDGKCMSLRGATASVMLNSHEGRLAIMSAGDLTPAEVKFVAERMLRWAETGELEGGRDK